jgi:hypothetical protein
MKICIGIPCFAGVDDRVLEDYCRFMFHLGRRYGGHEFLLSVRGKTAQHRARNQIAVDAIRAGCDYLFFLDDDHIIAFDDDPKRYDFLKKLLAHEVPIVGALYWQRGGLFAPVAMMSAFGIGYRMLTPEELTGCLQEVDVAGGGALLIDLKALERVEQPWFEDEAKTGYSTDVQICQKFRAAGFSVYLDSSVEIGHQMLEKRVVTTDTRPAIIAEREKWQTS